MVFYIKPESVGLESKKMVLTPARSYLKQPLKWLEMTLKMKGI